MSFHKRYISNEHVISTFNDGGASSVFELYTHGTDSLITEYGIASTLTSIFKANLYPRLNVEQLIDYTIQQLNKL